MRKGTWLSLFALLVMVVSIWPRATLAQGRGPRGVGNGSLLGITCNAVSTEAKIKLIAKRIVKDKVDQEVRDCYNSLADEDKARVFEAMAVERGISVEKLREEADENNRRMQEDQHSEAISKPEELHALTHPGSFWRQLIERIPFSAVFSTLYYPVTSWQDALCDGDPSDVDYMFAFQFPYYISQPDALRSFSYSPGVDAMLVYYQGKYGGIDGRGHTDRPGVHVCLGDNGVATAGGEAHVRGWLALHYY